MLAGIEEPSKGAIFFNEINLSSLKIDQKIILLQKKIGIVFQETLLINELTVLENVMLKEMMLKNISQQTSLHAQQLLDQVDLLEKADMMPYTLSGGQQQRISLLRAIFNKPDFLLADEPTGNLDQNTGQHIINLLLHYQSTYNMGLIISTHDFHIAQQMNYIITIHEKNFLIHKN